MGNPYHLQPCPVVYPSLALDTRVATHTDPGAAQRRSSSWCRQSALAQLRLIQRSVQRQCRHGEREYCMDACILQA